MDSYGIGSEGYQVLAGEQPDGGAGASMSAASDVFKAVAHPARAQILEMLSKGECTIPQLCQGTGVKATHLSRHLAQMRGEHLIQCRRSEGRLLYRLAYPEVAELLAAARSVLEARTAAAVSSLLPVAEEQLSTDLRAEQFRGPTTALVSRSVIADATQSVAARTGCTPDAAVAQLIATARSRGFTLLQAALEELRGGPEADTD
ncbi:hypothetical protein CXX84_03545 [Arthrobacter sp. AFG7.2]|nr:hypothetical protein CXX84_03545 [Arthrobacter sp. AFG7.2]